MKISPKVMQTSPKVSIQQYALKGQKLLAQGNTLGNGLAVGRVGAGQRADGADLKRSVARSGTAVAAVGGAAS